MTGEKQISCEGATRIRLDLQSKTTADGFDSAQLLVLQSHFQSCDTCRMDNALQRLMNTDSDGLPDALKRKRRIADAIAVARQSEAAMNDTIAKQRRDAPRWRTVLFAATLLTGIALGGLFFGGWGQHAKTHSHSVTTNESGSLEDEKSVRQHTATTGPTAASTKPSGTAGEFDNVSHIALASGVDVLLDSDTKLMIQQSEDALLRVSIDSGKMLVSVDPSVPHPMVEVVTAEGVVAVKGTIFSVSATPNVEVLVLRGVVDAIRHRGLTRVAAGHSFSFKSARLRSLQATETAALSRGVTLLQSHSKTAFPQHNRVALSPDKITTAPLLPGEVRHKHLGNAHVPLKPAIKKEIYWLLSDARQRKNNDDWRGALGRYEEIIALSPHSPAAATSHIAAGNIQLRLGDATAALDHFSSYLSSASTSLRQEAMYGKIKAFRQMNDYTNELATSRLFLAQWPNSVHADSLKNKIFHLEILAGVPATPKNK